jgi:hypothetical protein
MYVPLHLQNEGEKSLRVLIKLAQKGHRERHALLKVSWTDVLIEILTLWRSLRSNAQLPRFLADFQADHCWFSRPRATDSAPPLVVAHL